VCCRLVSWGADAALVTTGRVKNFPPSPGIFFIRRVRWCVMPGPGCCQSPKPSTRSAASAPAASRRLRQPFNSRDRCSTLRQRFLRAPLRERRFVRKLCPHAIWSRRSCLGVPRRSVGDDVKHCIWDEAFSVFSNSGMRSIQTPPRHRARSRPAMLCSCCGTAMAIVRPRIRSTSPAVVAAPALVAVSIWSCKTPSQRCLTAFGTSASPS